MINKLLVGTLAATLATSALADTTVHFTVPASQFLHQSFFHPVAPIFGTMGFIDIPAGGAKVTCTITNVDSVGPCQNIAGQLIGPNYQSQDGVMNTACTTPDYTAHPSHTEMVINFSGKTETFAIQTGSYTNSLDQATDANVSCVATPVA